MDLTSMMLYAAERGPNSLALKCGDTALTYAEWAQRVLALAGGLRGEGVAEGDRVAVGMRNSIEHATAFYAVQAAGAVAVPFNFRMKPESIVHAVRDSGAVALITDGAVRPEAAASVVAQSGARWISSGGERAAVPLEEVASAAPLAARPCDPDALSVVLYTSGTTGRPKGVPLTHRNAYERIVSYVSSAGPLLDSGVRTLGAAPLYHTVGLHWVLCLTVYLNGAYFPLSDTSPAVMSRLIADEELTFVFGSPTLLHMLVQTRVTDVVYPSVRDVSFGSAPMDAVLLGDLQRAFPNASINEVFGTTETSIPFVTRDIRSWPLGALRLTADHRVRIVAPGGTDYTPLPAGEVGELLVDMNNAASFTGYWHAEEKTARAVRNGWYHTGDAFERDEQGSYYIRGRLDDMFISGGENIQPLEVEQVLLSHPHVEDAAVIGTPDPMWGNVVTAFVEYTGDADGVDLDAYCRASTLDDFKRPRRVVVVPQIPRNPSGKIVRAELAALYRQMQEDEVDGGLAAQRR